MTRRRTWPAKLNPNAAMFLASLEKETGKRLTLENDFADLYRLHELGEAMSHPGSAADEAHLLDLPVQVEGVNFWRLGLGSILWLNSLGQWFDEDDPILTCAPFFAMAHARDRQRFADLNSEDAVRSAINEWADALPVSVESLELVARELTPLESSIPSKPGDGYGPVMSILLVEIGQDIDHWLWKASAETVEDVLDGLFRLRFDQNSDGKKANPFTPYMRACREFHYFKLELMKKHAKG